jgi:hypothetical protein
MKRYFTILICLLALNAKAQDAEIVGIIDELYIRWTGETMKLQSYQGLQDYCKNKSYRDMTTRLLDEIHHYDSVLYNIVSEKYKNSEDPEAKATLDDIEILEKDYMTSNFRNFLRQECTTMNNIENNIATLEEGEYEREVSKLEAELVKYVTAVTKQVEIVDEHVHHLTDGDFYEY